MVMRLNIKKQISSGGGSDFVYYISVVFQVETGSRNLFSYLDR
jgi:hypothetical protein